MNFKTLSLNTIAAASLLACLSISNAATVLLDFNPANACNGPCTFTESTNTTPSTSSQIAQNYGSVAGLLNVDFAPSGLNLASYWGPGYGSLNGVAYQNNLNAVGLGPQSTDPLTINFAAAAGFKITEFAFSFARYAGSDPLPINYSVTTNSINFPLSGVIQPDISGGTYAFYGFGPEGASSLSLKFGPENYFAAVDNIGIVLEPIGVSPIPEPGEWAMMLAGLGVVSAIARRRRSKVSA